MLHDSRLEMYNDEWQRTVRAPFQYSYAWKLVHVGPARQGVYDYYGNGHYIALFIASDHKTYTPCKSTDSAHMTETDT